MTYSNNKFKHKLSSFLGKWITVFTFFILPSAVTERYIELSLFFLLKKVKNEDEDLQFNLKKLNKLLDSHYTEKEVILPSYTIGWCWPDQVLDKTVLPDIDSTTLREAILNLDTKEIDTEAVADKLIKAISPVLKFRLNVSSLRVKEKLKYTFCKFIDEARTSTC